MNSENVKQDSNSVKESFFVKHKKIIKPAIIGGSVLIFLLCIFFALRLIGENGMKNYGTYMLKYGGSSVDYVTVTYDTEAEGFEQKIAYGRQFSYYASPSYLLENVEERLYRFRNNKCAKNYAAKLTETSGNDRKIFVVGNYVFDYPEKLYATTAIYSDAYIQQYNSAVNILSEAHEAHFGEALYRTFVAFDLKTGR